MRFLDYKICSELPEIPSDRKIFVNTINPHSYCLAEDDIFFKNALISSDFLIPDGIGVVWAFSFLYKKKIKKISGYDMHLHFLKLLSNRKGKVFYLGSSEETLYRIKNRLSIDFPALTVSNFSPPYKSEFSEEDSLEMLHAISKCSPDILFVGMTAPKQEKWVYKYREFIDAKVICSIGAVFDFYAGTVKRPNEFWIKLGLEWLFRFLKEPRRLWKRNLVSTPKFILDMLRIKSNLF